MGKPWCFCQILAASTFMLGAAQGAHAEDPAAARRPKGTIVAVMPVAAGALDEDAAMVLSDALAEALDGANGWRIIARGDLRALLAREAVRQGIGCEQDCRQHLSEVLGVQVLIAQVVNRLADQLVWAGSLVDVGTGEVLLRHEERAPTVDQLQSRAVEMALGISGVAGIGQLEGPQVQRALGFKDARTLKAFKSFRNANPRMAIPAALTAFVLARNEESRAMMLLEGSLLATAALIAPVAIMTAVLTVAVASGGQSHTTAGPPLAMLALAMGLVCAAVGAMAMLAGATAMLVAMVDGSNTGQVTLRKDGCCTDLATINDSKNSPVPSYLVGVPGLVAPAVFVALVPVAGAFGLLALTWVWRVALSSPASADRSWGRTYVSVTAASLGLGTAGLLAVAMLVVAPVVGLLLMFWPDEPLVERGA